MATGAAALPITQPSVPRTTSAVPAVAAPTPSSPDLSHAAQRSGGPTQHQAHLRATVWLDKGVVVDHDAVDWRNSTVAAFLRALPARAVVARAHTEGQVAGGKARIRTQRPLRSAPARHRAAVP